MQWPFTRTGAAKKARRTTTLNRSIASAFDASSFGRLLKDWNPTSNGANSAMLGGLHTMRNRCRDLARNNEWCASAVDSLVANVTDPGIMPISKAENTEFRAALRKLWADWGEVADAHGILSWDLLVGLAYRSMIESGEVFIRIRSRRTADGLPVPMQVQVIEADHVPADYTRTVNGNKIIAGVEFDKLGRRIAYWMYPEHPGESIVQGGMSIMPVRVDASEVIHLFDPKRPGQVRGYPQIVPVLVRMQNLGKYEDAELVKKLMTSLMVGVVTSPAPDTELLGDEETPEETGEQDEGANWARMEPGTYAVLAPGEDVKFSNPPTGDTNYEAHVKMNLRAVAATFGLTYEQMTGDLTGVNFSSIRAGLNEFQRRARRSQRLLIHQLCRPVMARWLDEAVFAGAIAAPNYSGARADYQRVEWRAPGWRYVNPQQEIAAIKESLKGGLTSRQAELAQQGYDVTEIDAQVAEDYARSKGLGLTFDTDPDGVDQANLTMQETPPAASDAPAPDAAPAEPDTATVRNATAGVAGLVTLARAMAAAEQLVAAEESEAANAVAAIIEGTGD